MGGSKNYAAGNQSLTGKRHHSILTHAWPHTHPHKSNPFFFFIFGSNVVLTTRKQAKELERATVTFRFARFHEFGRKQSLHSAATPPTHTPEGAMCGQRGFDCARKRGTVKIPLVNMKFCHRPVWQLGITHQFRIKFEMTISNFHAAENQRTTRLVSQRSRWRKVLAVRRFFVWTLKKKDQSNPRT
jgi:hypothetical protein